MIDLLLFIFALLQLAFIYGFYCMYMAHWEHAARITRLEQSKPKPEPKTPEKPQPKQIWEKEIEGFNPPKVETLRPNQVRGREVDDRRFEFDVKLKA